MKIRNVAHAALRRFIKSGKTQGLPAAYVEKIRNIVSYLQELDDVEELRSIPIWGAHLLTGDRKGIWSLTVSRNWRITFKIDAVEKEIVDLDFEDYH